MNSFRLHIKRVVSLIAKISMIAMVTYLLIAANYQLKSLPFKKLNINIDYDSGNYFVTKEEVGATFLQLFPDTTHLAIHKIHLKNFEDALKNNPFIKEVQVYTNSKESVHINIVQKSALFRVINKENVSFYLDKEGFKMPLSDNFTPRVIVITGNVNLFDDTMINHQQLQGLYKFVQHINSDSVLNALCEQIHVNDENELEIYPKLSSCHFLVGSWNGGEEKLQKMKIFYREILMSDTISEFNTINLKYKNQIICSKN